MSDYITQDLLVLILKRLPVKTLLQCRCVSKSWKQLIASKSFILDHLSVQTPRIVIQKGDLRYHLFDPHNTPPSFHILEAPIRVTSGKRSLLYDLTFSSVHGVNCVYNNRDLLLLFNPSTRQQLTIPLPEYSIRHSKDDFQYLGFWIDPSNNDFKVVIFCLETKKALVLSSKEQAWMELEDGMGDDMGDHHPDNKSPQVMIDGVAHWTASDEDDNEPGAIISFDFERNKFGTILPPHNVWGMYLCLCRWKDLLSVVHSDCIFDCVWDLWVMQNGSWTKMFRFDLYPGVLSVFCVVESTGRVLASTSGDNLVLHDPEDGFIPLNCDSGMWCSTFSYDFVESLVFPETNGIPSE